jgi:hypothetical protein
MKQEQHQCPYCKSPVEQTNLKRYTNGIMPIFLNDGCEFCQPLPIEEVAAYDSDD